MIEEGESRGVEREEVDPGSDHEIHSPYARLHDEVKHHEGEPWLVSYADMMTLLFGFFVLMYSIESAKKENLSDDVMEKVRRSLAEYFGGTYANPLEEVEKFINSSFGVASGKESGDVQVKTTPEGMKIVVRTQLLFTTGGSQLTPESEKMIRKIAALLLSSQVAGSIRVEGHTDDEPVNTPQFPSNWDLSAARASSVLRIFEASGFSPEKLTAVGYGSSRPDFPNRDAGGFPIKENQALNRRVVITVENSLDSSNKN